MAAVRTFGFCAVISRAPFDPSAPVVRETSGRSISLDGPGLRVAWSPRHAGEQPGSSWLFASERTICAIAGRVDNRRDAAHRLGDPGLARRGDAPLVAAAYEAWGEAVCDKLVGEYSFVVFDRQSGRALAGRDALGVGRLYLHQGDGAVIIASHLGSVLGLLPAAPAVDRESLVVYLGGSGYFLDERTPYAGVRGVQPGHVVVLEKGAVREIRSYRPDPTRRVRFRRTEEYDEQLRALLFEAVTRMLPASSPALLDVSGGLDSSTVACMAAMAAAGDPAIPAPVAFSFVASATDDFDPAEYIRSVVDRHGLEQEIVDLDRHLPCRTVDPDLLLLPDRWLFNGAVKAELRSAAERTGAYAWLTGDGGDQLFWSGPDPIFIGEYLRSGSPLRWMRTLRDYAARGQHSVDKLLRFSFATEYPASRAAGSPQRWLRAGVLDRVLEKACEEERGRVRLSSEVGWNVQLDRLLAASRAVQRKPAHCEARFPLLYRPLVEYMLAAPWEEKEIPGRGRVMQRRALEHILPDAIQRRTSKGNFGAFFSKGLAAHWRTIEPFTAGRRLADLGLVEPAAFAEACERFRHGQANDRTKRLLVAALTLEAWLELRPEAPACFETPLGDGRRETTTAPGRRGSVLEVDGAR